MPSLVDLYESTPRADEPARTRESMVRVLRETKNADVLVVGADLVSSLSAYLCAWAGLRVVLLEPEDYGFTTPWLQPLRPGREFPLDATSIFRLRELSRFAPHLVTPLVAASGFGGLTHTVWSAIARLCIGPGTVRSVRALRLVHELVLRAREEGALCLNHVSLSQVDLHTDGTYTMEWTDPSLGEGGRLTIGAIFNASGKPLPRTRLSGGAEVAPLTLFDTEYRMAYSFGQQLMQLESADAKCTVLGDGPMTYVLAERGVAQGALESILMRYDPLMGAEFARSLETARKVRLARTQGISPLLRGGVFEGFSVGMLDLVPQAIELVSNLTKTVGLPALSPVARGLPGAHERDRYSKDFRREAVQRGVKSELVDAALARFGGRVRYLQQYPDWSTVDGKYLRAEEGFVREAEQGVTDEDVLVRRLGV